MIFNLKQIRIRDNDRIESSEIQNETETDQSGFNSESFAHSVIEQIRKRNFERETETNLKLVCPLEFSLILEFKFITGVDRITAGSKRLRKLGLEFIRAPT